MSEKVIQIKEVHKRFGKVYAVQGVSLEVYRNEFVGLLGPNGAGKTTLIEMIEALQKPDSGIIEVLGKDVRFHPELVHQELGIALQETRFIDKLRVEETLSLFASFYGCDQESIREILELVQLEEKKNAYTVHLSGGQKQRLALGLALLHKPSIVLLDEPSTGLDPATRRDLWEILQRLKKERQLSMILTTHYMEEASFLCDRIYMLHQGKIIGQGTFTALKQEFSIQDKIHLTFAEELSDGLKNMLNKKFGQAMVFRPRQVEFRSHELEKNLPDLLSIFSSHHQSVQSMEWEKASLDELFLKITGK